MRYHYISIVLAVFVTLTFTSSFILGDLQAQQNQKSVTAGKESATAENKPATAEKKSATTGEELLTVKLQAPENKLNQAYLGINGETFNISDISASVVIVQIFSMYCPHCQRDAPNMNNFFNLIQKSESYKDKIKLIGIGVGNSLFEVDFFRKTYSVEFPLLPDQDFKIHKLLGQVRTPYFIGFKRLKDGSLKLFMSESGGDREPQVFIEQIIKQAGRL